MNPIWIIKPLRGLLLIKNQGCIKRMPRYFGTGRVRRTNCEAGEAAHLIPNGRVFRGFAGGSSSKRPNKKVPVVSSALQLAALSGGAFKEYNRAQHIHYVEKGPRPSSKTSLRMHGEVLYEFYETL